MTLPPEAQVLDWFEQALDHPVDERGAWLDRQGLPAWLHQRVLRLLQTESSLGGFLEQAPALPEAPSFPQVGERVGSYELLREIDAGGMGVVFLARRADKAYDQQVAIKLIRPLHLGASAPFRDRLVARFETERALLARLDHRNVARILDGGSTAAGLPYLVMEYVDGVSLTAWCDTQRLDVAARVRVFAKVCDGVQEAHRHLIVHRDLKPENILVPQDGEPRLLDFGIARTLDGLREEPTATMTALTAMTPAYASPEQVRQQPLTTSSDVYSLGVVLYQLVAGARPYELARLTPAEVERLVCESAIEPLRVAIARAPLDPAERSRRQSQTGADLERIVAKALHKEAARRYASAQELADDLRRYLDGQPVLAHPDSTAYRVGKFVRRHRLGVAAAGLALVAILVAAGVASWQASVARGAARDMERINDFLLDVLKMSDPFDAGSELTLSQALDGAAGRIDERFADRPDLSAQIRFGVGYSMLSRYRLEAAEKQLQRALEESTAAFGPDDLRTLRVLEGIAGLRQEQDRPDEARRLFEQVIAKVESSGYEHDPLYVALLGNLGNLLLIQEQYPDAQTYLSKARDAYERSHRAGERSLDHANLVSNLAHAAHGLGDLDGADALYAQAQQEMEALFPAGNPDLAVLLNNRALLAEDRADTPLALALHRQSLDVRRRVFGGEHPMIVVALSNVARGLLASDPPAALAMAQDAVAMADRVYTTPSSRHASVYATLAEARLVNVDAAGAIAAWQRAQALMVQVSGPSPSAVSYLERVRGTICAQAHAVAAAICAGPRS